MAWIVAGCSVEGKFGREGDLDLEPDGAHTPLTAVQ